MSDADFNKIALLEFEKLVCTAKVLALADACAALAKTPEARKAAEQIYADAVKRNLTALGATLADINHSLGSQIKQAIDVEKVIFPWPPKE